MQASVFPEGLLKWRSLKHFTLTVLREEQFERIKELLVMAVNLEELEVTPMNHIKNAKLIISHPRLKILKLSEDNSY